MRYFFVAAAWWVCGTSLGYAEPAPAETPNKHAVGVPVFFSDDSEGFSTRKIGGAFYPYYEHGNHYAGLLVTRNDYSQTGWDRRGMQYSLVARDIATRTGMGYTANVGVNTQDGRALLTTDSSWSKRWSDATATELFINRDWVESQAALDDGISHTFAGGSVEYKLLGPLTAVGMLGEQFFSDGNRRDHARLRLIYDLFPSYGITLQGRLRYYRSGKEDVASNYFNPERYREEMLALGLRRRIEGWVVNGTLGLGRQHIDSDPSTQTRLAEIGVESPIVNQMFLRMRAGYNQSAGFNGPSYTYKYLQGELVFSY